MLNLSRHIESLLLDHNCVIIPGFGGFITQYTSARYIKEEGIFLPPYRNIIFNKELVLNDFTQIEKSQLPFTEEEYKEVASAW